MTTHRGSMIPHRGFALIATGLWIGTASAANPVAGLEPYQRPAGAPTVAAATPDANALHGVIKPAPASIDKFMKDQGNWYTPFTHPGMPTPYDIRGWHSNPPSSGKR